MMRYLLKISEESGSDLYLIAKDLLPLTEIKEEDYESILENQRTSSGEFCPLPPLILTDEEGIRKGDEIIFHNDDLSGTFLVEKVKEFDKEHYLMMTSSSSARRYEKFQLFGKFSVAKFNRNFLRLDKKIKYCAVHSRNPLSKLYKFMVEIAFSELSEKYEKGNKRIKILYSPFLGRTRDGDFTRKIREKSLQLQRKYLPLFCSVGVLPCYMRFAGKREILFHALIRKRMGCRYFLIGRDHASSGIDKIEVWPEFEEIGIVPIPIDEIRYDSGQDVFTFNPNGEKVSSSEAREWVKQGLFEELERKYYYPEFVDYLKIMIAKGEQIFQ